MRIYAIGSRYFAFNVISPELDYRSTQNCRVESTEVPAKLAQRLGALLDMLGLDFAAADFKRCPKTKRMLFLEVNSGPMFAAFDAASDRAVSRALVRALR